LTLHVKEETIETLNLLRQENEDDDGLLRRIVEYARCYMVIRGAEDDSDLKCPNCGAKVSQRELDENRGVCGLCYEFFASKGRGMEPEEP